tara:strand:+ start:9866 stop:11356 length:1491 start_codon:yes stop_codon:yes gene_type:complete
MSSKAVAQALLSYGADLKIKNIVCEMFFSIVPMVYMNKFRIIDNKDELIVDLFFQYVKAVLRERQEYTMVAQNLTLETYPDLPLDELTPAEASLLAELAIKRVVYRSLERLNEKIYADSPSEIASFDPSINKQRFSEKLLNEILILEPTNRLSFLSVDNAKIAEFDDKFVRSYKNNDKLADAEQVRYAFESYIRLEAKDLSDIILCTEELTSLNKDGVTACIREVLKMFAVFYSGDETFNPDSSGPDLGMIIGALDIISMSGKSAVCSVDDFEGYYGKVFLTNLTLKTEFGIGIKTWISNKEKILNALFKSITVGVRCVVKMGTKVAQNSLSKDVQNAGFPEKAIYYEQKYFGDYVGRYPFFTLPLASKEQQFAPEKLLEIIEIAKKFNDINLNTVYQYNAVPKNVSIVTGLLIELIKTPEFDAIIKSSLVPAMLFNTISTIPNVEIGQDLIPIMRQSGVFKGMDEVLNEMFSSLRGYLLGDHPWLKDCGDLAGLL